MSRPALTVPTPALALRRAQAAAAVGVSLETFDREVRPFVAAKRLGSVTVYPVAALERFLADATSINDDLKEAPVVETIDPAAFSKSLADRADVRGLVDHDPSQLLGRVKNGTLRLAADQTGVRRRSASAGVPAGRAAPWGTRSRSSDSSASATAWLQKRAAEEQKQLNASNAVKQLAFDRALAALQDHLAKGHTSTQKAMDEMTALLRKYGVTFGAVGRDMGIAWVQGLKDALSEAAKKSGSLTATIQKQAAGIAVPHAAAGGYVAQSGLAIIHQGENIIPARQGKGSSTIHLTVNALDPRSAATLVIEALNDWERSNGPRYARA